jgi:hypothetical protein
MKAAATQLCPSGPDRTSGPSGPDLDLPEIDGIEQLETPPAGARPFTATYYRDEASALVEELKAIPAREKHCVAPRLGWPKRIYRKAELQPTAR